MDTGRSGLERARVDWSSLELIGVNQEEGGTLTEPLLQNYEHEPFDDDDEGLCIRQYDND